MNKARMRIAFMLMLLFFFSVGAVVRQHVEYRNAVIARETAIDVAGLQKVEPSVAASDMDESLPELSLESEEPSNSLPEDALGLVEIDLESLRAVNSDVVGWIDIPGTPVSYPLLQGKDNQYYLNHSWKKEPADSGSVFLECTNNRDLSGFNTIVYGHRMRNDTVFGSIKYYKSLDYWQEHPSVYITLDDVIYRYDIFSAEEASVTGIVYRLDIRESHLEDEFIEYCKDRSVIDTGLIPESVDRFLTLSTCTGNGYANRWVVHGFLAQEYRRADV